ncbi:MAG TPA: LuxR C-terminal-related transcriptional regulator [Candidatus Dormibacteraeota bacterium]
MAAGSAESAPIRLSRRELEVARLVADGLTNREIAGRLFISERTVDGHLEHVREKLGVNTRAQVAAWVVRQAEPAVQAPPRAPVRTKRRVSSRLLLLGAVALVGLEAFVVLAVMPAPGPVIDTVAGNENVSERYPLLGDFGGDGQLARNALLSLPTDVAVAPDGTLYIADYRNGRIRRVDRDGRISTYAGAPGSGKPIADGRLAASVDLGHASNLAVDSQGIVYLLTVSPASRLEVWRIDKANTVTLAVDLGPSSLGVTNYFPLAVGGIALSKDGTMFVSDRARNEVWKYVPGQPQASVIVGPGAEGALGDGGPAKDASLLRPAGLAYVDRTGELYIADAGHNRIRRVDRRGVITTFAGSGSYYGDSGDGGLAGQARLSFPYGVAVGSDGTVYIADTGNNRIRKVTPSGVVQAFAGTGNAGFRGDGGSALGASFRAPEAIAFDTSGDLLVADTINHRVREIAGIRS